MSDPTSGRSSAPDEGAGIDALRQRIASAIDAAADELRQLSEFIHGHPEASFEEHEASAHVAAALERHGYKVDRPVATLPTAVRGTLTGRAGPGPRVAVLAESDALPGLGHACGHNLMAASGVGAAIGLAAIAEDLPGEVLFLGTPAEERGSGKQVLIDAGLFDGVACAILFHPSDATRLNPTILALEDVEVTFGGRAAHAATQPWEGRNALDALVLLLVSIGLWRQQLRPDARVHGVVVEGGGAVNAIPDLARAQFTIRAADGSYLSEMRDRFEGLCQAAALASACTWTTSFSGRSDPLRSNPVLLARYAANLEVVGIREGPSPERLVSSDMGNVSQVVPAIHPFVAICEPGTPLHSKEFREAAVRPRATDVMLAAAVVCAQTACEVLVEPGLELAIGRAFRAGEP